MGVDLEEAGEKWRAGTDKEIVHSVRIPDSRAGDAQKSARFFLRALDVYENGLQHFRGSFDLAYNR